MLKRPGPDNRKDGDEAPALDKRPPAMGAISTRATIGLHPLWMDTDPHGGIEDIIARAHRCDA